MQITDCSLRNSGQAHGAHREGGLFWVGGVWRGVGPTALLTEMWPSASRLLQCPSQLSWCFCYSWIPERALRAISLCISCLHCIPSNSCASHFGYFYSATFILGQLDSWGGLSGGSTFSGYQHILTYARPWLHVSFSPCSILAGRGR